MQSDDWTAEQSAALRENFGKGLSYSEIARAINAKFKTAYSRNATIGRAKRMGLAGSGRPKRLPKYLPPKRGPRKPPLKAEAAGLRRSRQQAVSDFMWPMPVFERVEQPVLRCVEITPRGLSLVDLEPGDCRYPYGGDEEGEAITFCGHPRREGSSYCVSHFHLTRGPGVLYERAASSISLRLVTVAEPEQEPEEKALRLKLLPPGHRVAHLRALIGQQPVGSVRRERLMTLLRAEMVSRSAAEERAI